MTNLILSAITLGTVAYFGRSFWKALNRLLTHVNEQDAKLGKLESLYRADIDELSDRVDAIGISTGEALQSLATAVELLDERARRSDQNIAAIAARMPGFAVIDTQRDIPPGELN